MASSDGIGSGISAPIMPGAHPSLSRVIDAHAALRYLLREWDVLAEPHILHAQFSAIETCVRDAERALVEIVL